MTTTPAYFGAELDLPSLEIATIARIDRKTLRGEAALYARKWFDYRPLHPAAATYLMMHHYNQAYGDFIGKALNHKLRYKKAIKGGDVMAAHEAKSFWRLRQKIDELGMRYEFFLRTAMAVLIARGWGKGTPHPPRPAHLLNDDELIVEVSNAWARECRAKIQYARDPRYQVHNWTASADQLEYQAWLIEQIKRRPHPHYALSVALYQFDALRIEAAIEHFEPQVITDAIELCRA